jgi:hypothetical protein
MRTLFFESAGCVPRGEVENCRVRTAFINDEGKKVYAELTGVDRTNEASGYCDFLHYITDDPTIDDCNDSVIKDGNGQYVEKSTNFLYTKKGILEFVNKWAKASFTNIQVLPRLAGYRALNGGRGGYNLMDEFYYNEERTTRYIKIEQKLHDCFKELFSQKYSNASMRVEYGAMSVRINACQKDVDRVGIRRDFKFDVAGMGYRELDVIDNLKSIEYERDGEHELLYFYKNDYSFVLDISSGLIVG